MKRYAGALLLTFSLFGAHAAFSDETKEPEAEPTGWPSSIVPSEKQLKSLSEPDLSSPPAKGVVDIRFIWVPTFHQPISIRATKSGDSAELTIVRMKGKGGYDWGDIEQRKKKPITEAQWKELEELIAVERARKPSLKAADYLRKNWVEIMSGLDGSQWFLEVRGAAGYTVEGVPNPIVSDPVRAKVLKEDSGLDLAPFLAACFKLFDLSGLESRPDYYIG